MPVYGQRRNRLGVPPVYRPRGPSVIGQGPGYQHGGGNQGGGGGMGEGGDGHGGGGGGPHLSLQQRISRLINRSSKPPNLPDVPNLSAGQIQRRTAAAENDPSSLLSLPGYQPTAGHPDPRDAQYWQDVNKLLFNATQDYNKGVQEQSYNTQDYTLGKATMARQDYQNQQALGQGSLASGLAHSGALDTADAQRAAEYATNQFGLDTSYQRSTNATQSALSGILSGYQSDAQQALLDSAQRFGQNQLQNATTGAGLLNPKVARRLNRMIARSVVGRGQHNRRR